MRERRYARTGHASATSDRAASRAASVNSGLGSSAAAAITPSTSTEICVASRSGSAAPASRAGSVGQARTARLCSTVAAWVAVPGSVAPAVLVKRAAAEAVPLGRRAQRVEEADEPVPGAGAGRLGGLPQRPAPALVRAAQIGPHQIVLGADVGGERRLRHARLGDDPVHSGPRTPWALNRAVAVDRIRSWAEARALFMIKLLDADTRGRAG
ncbi:hypothetical protein Z951_11555 [Streptomyces sp. PRh5]|uniref:hypothetical protein n=1 Tax=Streptomyces sp. PRh5 TaxID=1158056 RepID=UPI00044D498F|nr:hypothetical protein [Streptomyces sp. PRh5]EXU68098.1 hypothetical protein Z951_11555 [Streptomyces sp. PRh5]